LENLMGEARRKEAWNQALKAIGAKIDVELNPDAVDEATGAKRQVAYVLVCHDRQNGMGDFASNLADPADMVDLLTRAAAGIKSTLETKGSA
jgi:hypothetical protein